MMNEKQDDFLFDETKTKKLMRKARLRSTIKIIGITIIVTPIVLIGFWYGLRTLSLNSAQEVMDDIRVYKEISSPNVQISNQTYDYNLFGGKINTTTYKVLGENHRPYIWEPVENDYNLFGTLFNYSSGSIQIEGSDSLAKHNQIERFNLQTGDREMFFYHPEIVYDVYKDNMNELNQFEKNTLVELGLSFDKAYHFEEIKSKLPSDVQVDWWWVDAYTEERMDFLKQGQNTIPANYPLIFGFQSEQSKPKAQQSELLEHNEITSFINNIESLRESKNFKWETDEVYKALVGKDGVLDQSDVKIIGVVVTGTPDQLKSLQGQPYIMASTLGVISNRK